MKPEEAEAKLEELRACAMRTMSRQGIRSVVSENLQKKIENPIYFKPLRGDLADGYEADVLIDVCDALIEARRQNQLRPSQMFALSQLEG